MFESAGIDKFLYRGPKDMKTRPFCEERVGKTYMKAQIAKMTNGTKLAPVSIYGGGYNCRHVWAAVVEESEPAMTETAMQPMKLKKGSHFEAVESELSATETTKVLGVVRDEGLLGFLKNHPLAKIELSDNLPSGWAGGYWPNRIVIRPGVSASEFGEEFEPGKNEFSYSSAKSRTEALQRKLLHEIGHHILNAGKRPAYDITRLSGRNPDKAPLTRYGRRNATEYFTESWVMYNVQRRSLRASDPVGFRMVEEVLGLVGIL